MIRKQTMFKHYSVSRFLAIVAGFASAGAALYMILEDAIRTGLTVYTSVGRQARVADTAAARSADVEKQRAAVTASLAKAELMLAEEQAALAKECASGKGKRCDGVKASVDV